MDRLAAMRVFVAVVEEQGFSAASRALRMPLSTVSRKIAELENHIGAQLLTRSTRGHRHRQRVALLRGRSWNPRRRRGCGAPSFWRISTTEGAFDNYGANAFRSPYPATDRQ